MTAAITAAIHRPLDPAESPRLARSIRSPERFLGDDDDELGSLMMYYRPRRPAKTLLFAAMRAGSAPPKTPIAAANAIPSPRLRGVT